MPQIEVKFDIDANGILNVTAVDTGTGKQQTNRIESSSGLSEAEVERMRKEAEAHARDDKERRELVDLRNQVDHLVYQTGRQLEEHKAKLPEADAKAIEEAKTALEEAARGDDKARIEAALADFQKKVQKLGEIVYAQNAGAGAGRKAAAARRRRAGGSGSGERSGGSDRPVDADFEVKA
jgi:molecular chaperone DnaK